MPIKLYAKNSLTCPTFVRKSRVLVNESVNKFTAKPLLSNIKNYPLINELVLILSLPDIGIKASTSSKSKYY